jgi:hypothetical protein
VRGTDAGRRVAYSSGRLLQCRTIVVGRHPRPDSTAFLQHMSAAAELFVINLVAQHDPEPDSEFTSCCDSRFSQTLLHLGEFRAAGSPQYFEV